MPKKGSGPVPAGLPRLLRILDAWAPHVTQPQDRQRVRLLVAICTVLLFASIPVLAALFRVAGLSPSVKTLLVSDVVLLLNLALLRKISPHLVGAKLCLEMLVSFSLIAMFNGGLESASWLWTLTIPVIAAFAVSARFGVVCALLLIADVVIFYVVTINGFEFPTPETGASHPAFVVLGLTTATAFLALLSVLYERLRHRGEHARTQILANMSHEIRTPMNAIVGLSDLLLLQDLQGRDRHYVKTIRDSATDLLGVLNDVLDLSMIEAESMRVTEQVFDLGACLEGVLATMQPSAEEKGLSLDLDYAPGQWVEGDPLRLRQVLINLVSNAVKFTGAGYVQVTARREADTSRFRFEVRDTGPGVEPERLAELLKPFERGRQAVSVGGVGLGLAISHRLIELMGGRLGVSENEPRGSTFHFSIPLPDSERVEVTSTSLIPQAPTGDRKFSVLLADDEPLNQMVASELLKTMGGEVVCQDDGRAALEACAKQSFDLIFLDCIMPELDGFEVARRLRSETSTQTCPIIALTASAMEGDRERCLAAGMDDYLTKPVKAEELRAAVDRWLAPHDAF